MTVLLDRLGDLVIVAIAALVPILGVLTSPPMSEDFFLIVDGVKRQAETTDWNAAIVDARHHVGNAFSAFEH